MRKIWIQHIFLNSISAGIQKQTKQNADQGNTKFEQQGVSTNSFETFQDTIMVLLIAILLVDLVGRGAHSYTLLSDDFTATNIFNQLIASRCNALFSTTAHTHMYNAKIR